jgi:hypothetical protein
MSSTAPDFAPDESSHDATPSRVVRLLQIAGWDGALPLVVALGPVLVRTICPKPPVAVGLFLVLAPPVAALIRAHIGWHQIAKRCGGHAPWLRQVAMAAAIVLLLVFEAAVGILTFNDNVPVDAWWIPVGFYAGYLVMISFALRSTPQETPFPCGTGGVSE